MRAGYVRPIGPGLYSWLPLGLRVLRKIEKIVRDEMNAIGGQEILFPALLPKAPYEVTNRWTEYGDGVFRLQDRRGNDYLLGPTHEELFTLTVKGEYSSYKDFPLLLFQIQTKYRDEARPRAGILRGREFLMKDSYSFDVDDAGLEAVYHRHRDAYQRIFTTLGVRYVIVSAVSGAMGGSASEEFLAEGYIGPKALLANGVRYLVDPRVVDGTSWITGADEPGKHVVGLVAGRDFVADGTIEAAEVRDGDPSPDGAGPLVSARGIEIGHIFQLGRKYTDAFTVDVLGEDGKPVRLTMGSYGLGVSRMVAVIAEQHHDELGLRWPTAVAPFDVHLVIANKDDQARTGAMNLAEELDRLGVEVLLDDRQASPGVKFKDAELLGVPWIVVVGRGWADGVVELRDRFAGQTRELAAGASLAADIAAAL